LLLDRGKLEIYVKVEQAIPRLAEILRTEKHFQIRLDIADTLGEEVTSTFKGSKYLLLV
jgi:hypothetical protein